MCFGEDEKGEKDAVIRLCW